MSEIKPAISAVLMLRADITDPAEAPSTKTGAANEPPIKPANAPDFFPGRLGGLGRRGPPPARKPYKAREQNPGQRTPNKRHQKPDDTPNTAPNHPGLDGARLFLLLVHGPILTVLADVREPVQHKRRP